MALVPMRQQITVSRGGGVDEWGNPINPLVFTLACRIDEGTQLITSHSAGNVVSEQVIGEARILLDKLADIKPTDVISFTNELGEETTRKPKKIDIKRNVAGKPILTEVIV